MKIHRMPPLVSVILPVRDAASTIGAAIASIRGQSFAHWELVAVDDGSTDATVGILGELAREEPRMRVLRQPAAGVVAALDAGLRAAGGEFIARMDADDESFPTRLAEQAAFLADPGHRHIGLVSCLVEYGGNRRTNAGYALYVDWINSLLRPESIALNRFIESPFAHPSVMFRRELPGRFGGYRAGGFPEDYELWLRWLDAGVLMAKLPRVLLRWNDRPERLSRTDPRYDPEAFFEMKAEWIARAVRIGGGAGRRILVWGAGRPTRKRAAHLERHGVRIAGYVDIDARKATRALGGTGVPVIPPQELPAPREAFVLGYVSTRGARDLIRDDLTRRDYVEGRDFLMCA